MDYQVAYNPTTKTALLQDVGDDIPEGSVDVGTFTRDALTPLSQGVADLLYKRSWEDPSELASWPDNITDMSLIIIKFSDGTIEDLELLDQVLADGEDGVDYTFTPGFAGGVPSYSFDLITPPTGCTIDANTGEVTFVAPAADDYEIEVELTDGAETVVTKVYDLTVV